MQVQLVMFKADGQRREFVLRKDVTIIGRAIECDFQIPLPAVSRKHCQITVRQDHISVRDLGSSTGTYVNDQRLQEADLEPGDKLAVGPVTFTVIVDGQPADIATVRTTARPVAADLEVDGGTVDVEALQEQQAVSSVKTPSKTPAKPQRQPVQHDELEELTEISEPDPVDHLEVVEEVEEVEVIEEVAEAGESGAPAAPVKSKNAKPEEAASDPLSALAAMSQQKRQG